MEDKPINAVATELLPQRWMCLAAMIIAIFGMQFSLIIMPGIASYIIPELGITPAQFGMLANMPYLAGVLFGIIAGNIGDKIGIKRIMNIACIVFIVGAFWRAFSSTYTMLMISSLIMGLGNAVINANSTKGIRLWFPGKAMGPAMGLYIAGASLGAGAALMLGAIWGTRTSLLACAVISIIVFVVWATLYRQHPAEMSEEYAEAKIPFSAVITNKNVWIISIMMVFVFGNSTTIQTYMNAALGLSSGGLMALVGAISLTSTIVVSIASISLPAVIAKFKSLKSVMMVICLIEAALTASIFLVPFGPITIILVVLTSIFLGAILAMGKTVPALLPGIDPRSLGTIGGFQSTLQNIGGWFMAGFVIAPIAQGIFPAGADGVFGMNTYVAIYFGAALCTILVLLCYAMLPKETPTHLEIK